MMIEMFTNDYHEVLHYVATRLVFMDSILNPFIYARMTRYVTAFREITCCPFRYCGCYTKPYPDGMTGLITQNIQRTEYYGLRLRVVANIGMIGIQ